MTAVDSGAVSASTGAQHRAAPNAAMNARTAQNGQLSSDFQTFLTMLTTQMRNQDPLNPMEASDFAVQLATFSGVEQQVRTNDLLAGLASRLGLSDLGNWIGMEVRAAVPAWYDGAPISVAAAPAPGADRAELVVRNALGRVVDRTDFPLNGADSVTWGGIGPDGSEWPSGHYSFALASYHQGAQIELADAEVYARVRETTIGNGEVQLRLEGGGVVAADLVRGLRAPD